VHIFDESASAAAAQCQRSRSRLQVFVTVSYSPERGGSRRDPRSSGLVRPGTEVKDRTAGAVGPLGFADGPTVKDEEVGDEGPLFSGNDPAELLLDFVLFVALGEA